MKNQTINSIVSWIERFSVNNPFVRGFGSGDTGYFNADVMKYPFLWVSPMGSIFTLDSNNTGIIFEFNILIMDRVNYIQDKDNELDIISDSTQVAQDLIFLLRRDGEFKVNSASVKTAYQGASTSNNKEVGVILQLQIKAPYIACITPEIIPTP
tara:strand:- start:768 stop:1229 length:462 start_codon:yes stop_codon:yes gene_type:complete